MADLEIAVDLITAFRSSPPMVGKHHVNLQKWFDDVTGIQGFKEICDITKLKNGNGNSTKRTKAKNLPVVESNPLKVPFTPKILMTIYYPIAQSTTS